MATLQELVEEPQEVYNEGENPFQYLVVRGEYQFKTRNTINLENQYRFAGNEKEGQIYFIVKPDYQVEIEITTKRNGYFQGIERNVGSEIFQEFGIATSRGGGRSQMSVTLEGGSMVALHVGGQGRRTWGDQADGIENNDGEDSFTREVLARGISEPSRFNDGLLLSLANPFDRSTYTIVANDPDRDTTISMIGYSKKGVEESVIPTIGDVVFDDEESSSSEVIQDSNYEVIDEFNGVDVDGYPYSVIFAFDDLGYFVITDGSRSDRVDNEADGEILYSRLIAKRVKEGEISERQDITDDRTPFLDPLLGDSNIMLIGGLIIVGIVVLIAVNAFSKGVGEGVAKSLGKDSTTPSKGEGLSE